jgi:twitching motility protein PilJ
MGKTFLQSLLIRVSSFFAIIFTVLGLVFFYAFYIGVATNGLVGIVLAAAGAVLTIVSLFVTNLSTIRLQNELKEGVQLAHQISQGDVSGDFGGTNSDENSELISSLHQIAVNLQEKSAIADRVAKGDLSAEIELRSEADIFGASFKNMIDELRLIVQTEEERTRLQSSIFKLLSEVKEVASGDLTVKAQVTSEVTGEIAEAFNFMTVELRSLISQVKEVTFQVGSSATAINDTTEQLARGSEAQAAQISRTTSAISNMALQIQEVSKNASLSAQVADDSLNNARYGTKAVTDNINAMDSIRRQVQETAKRIKKLGERSQEIGQIVGLIDDLSDRTSLLALNASLQAAGSERERGFSVVAEEVERLAERSNRLTQQIAGLAQTIQVETKDVVASMEETIHEVVVGSTLADKAGQTLIEIEQVSQRLAKLIQSISESANRQAQSSEDISKEMANISKVTELVNDGSKRAAESVKTLVVLSNELRGSVAPFKLPDDRRAFRRNLDESSEIYVN